MQLLLTKTIRKGYYFRFDNEPTACTSKGISKLFDLDVNTYNKLLIDKVIQHNKYSINPDTKDLLFVLNNTSEEVYLNRFKEIFTNQLTLIYLGGGVQ